MKNQPPTLDSKAFRCCLCCHVKTGTLIYGIATILLHLVLLGLLVLAAIHPDVLMGEENRQPYDGIVVVQTESGDLFGEVGHAPHDDRFTKDWLPDYAANEMMDFPEGSLSTPSSLEYLDNLCVAFAMTLGWILAVLALMYGVARNYASYLMPCFCLQVFDFCLTCLTFVGCFTYAPNVKEWIRQSGLSEFPIFRTLECFDREFLMLVVVSTLILILSFKAYLIGMVWSCYKYILLRVASRSVVREYSVDPDTQILLPPCYEDAIKIPVNYPEPPSYTTTTE